MSKKVKEPEELVKINTIIREYGGVYANWKSSSFSGKQPERIINLLVALSSQLDKYTKNYREKETETEEGYSRS